MYSFDQILLLLSVLLLLSIFVSKVSTRYGIPTLLLFLGIGMLAGSDGLGGVYFNDSKLTQDLGVIALAYILFSGGIDTNWSKVKQVFLSGLSLSTLGVFFTTISIGIFAHLVFHFSLLEGILIGAIVSSTDAAAVFSILRSQKVKLKGQIRETIELESGSNDPMSVFLTIAFIRLIKEPDSGVFDLFILFIKQMLIGGIFGVIIGKLSVFIINHIRLQFEGLYPVLTISIVIFCYSFTNYFQGSGFLAVYLCGIVLGEKDFIHKKSILKWHDGLSWLMQITMFLVLGLLVFPKQLIDVIGFGILLSLFLILIARPFSVFISLFFSKFDFKDKAFISWVGLRGAVPIILATFPKEAGILKADIIFNIVFFVVITSILIQSSLLSFFGSFLKVNENENINTNEFIKEETGNIETDLVSIIITKDSKGVGKQIVELGLPEGALIILLTRNEKYIIPRGSTILIPDDVLLILVQRDLLPKIEANFKAN